MLLCPCTDDDDDGIPEELLLGKQQFSELSSDSAKMKAMGITSKVSGTRDKEHCGIIGIC